MIIKTIEIIKKRILNLWLKNSTKLSFKTSKYLKEKTIPNL